MKRETKQGLAVVGTMLGVGGAVLAASRVKAAPLCTPGTTKCVGFDLLECDTEHKWVLLEANSPTCGWVPPEAVVSVEVTLEPVTESPSPGVIYAGGMMGIRCTATNTGDVLAEYTPKFYVNNELVWSDSHKTLPPGYTRDYYYRYTVPAIEHYDVRVTLDGFEGSTSFDAIEAPAGVPDISTFKPLTSSWRVGEVVYVWGSAWVTNDGDGSGEYVEEWYIDDVLVGTSEGYLAPGAYDCNEKVWYNSDLGLTPGGHGMHVVLKWNGHEDRYPKAGYSTFNVPS